jgi:hypothetical protein
MLPLQSFTLPFGFQLTDHTVPFGIGIIIPPFIMLGIPAQFLDTEII